MIYFQNEFITIRKLNKADAENFSEEFRKQGWDKHISSFEEYFEEQEKNKIIVFVAEYQKQIAGYVILKQFVEYGPFRNKNIPEVHDFNVLIKYRNKGIGTKLLDILEDYVVKQGKSSLCLSVGLHNGYGQAQRMYVKRGYIPDGSGVWFNNTNLEQYLDCKNDDSLVLYLKKDLNN